MEDKNNKAALTPADEPSPREREFCEWMIGFNSDPKFVQEFTTRFINACNERVMKGGYPEARFSADAAIKAEEWDRMTSAEQRHWALSRCVSRQ